MKPNARRKSRALAVQGIYSWQLSQNKIQEIEQQLLLENNVKQLDVAYFQDLLRGVVSYQQNLDELLTPYLDRPFDGIDQVEKAILRVSAYEMKYRVDVPYKVVINEAIELAKSFAADDSHKFVNGILDKAARTLRPN
ncbi:transcription antitermination factor NusB [Alkalimonas delamerensis]|uniref:Transcription antitermination protein NusB n=1 Tax=Alkalimonas delamerensis TaxID=265981 RepID=A0ABT9GSC7_9GAMM|nr:transcription antitermination factor NusB [Alkalimonas delamerensis]MDP4529675.1 transcription antitermination factor NusB [Alkalimonas delamerensis]